jgi:hypothetical protein
MVVFQRRQTDQAYSLLRESDEDIEESQVYTRLGEIRASVDNVHASRMTCDEEMRLLVDDCIDVKIVFSVPITQSFSASFV